MVICCKGLIRFKMQLISIRTIASELGQYVISYQILGLLGQLIPNHKTLRQLKQEMRSQTTFINEGPEINRMSIKLE